MPIRKSQATGWLHDDYKVQREFERLGKQVSKNSVDTAKANTNIGFGGVGEGSLAISQGQELTTLRNDSIITDKVVKELNFKDKGYEGYDIPVHVDVFFKLKDETLEPNPDKSLRHQTIIEAYGKFENNINIPYCIERDFTYADLQGADLLLGTIPNSCRIDSIYITINAPMDSGELNVYTVPDNLVILPSFTVIPNLINTYHKNFTIKTLSNSEIFLTFVGQNPTQGYGRITIIYNRVQ